MRRLLTFIWVVVGLMVMVTGCHRVPRYDNRLMAADSLMRSSPDSALAIINAVNPDSLVTEGDCAYHDLLLTQARYRCYITATSDSAINRALGYYRLHSNEREKLTRAFIYKGAVMEELGHPDSAMFYYKHAEYAADTSDYFNLGYVNLRIGQLYQTYYTNGHKVVDRMQKAGHYFEIIGDTNYLITAIGTQGAYKDIIGEDSAHHLLEKAILLSKKANSSKRFKYQSKLAGFLYYYTHDYRGAIDLSMDIVKNGQDYSDEKQFYYYAAWSYLKLGLLDSAYWVKSIIPEPENAVDSMNYYQLLADLSFASRQYREYGQHIEKAKSIHSHILENTIKNKLELTEIKWDVNSKEVKYKKETKLRWLEILSVILLLVIISIYVAIKIVKNRIHKYQTDLLATRQELESIMHSYKQEQQELKQEIKQHQIIIKTKEKALKEKNNQFKKLEAMQDNMQQQISSIVRLRLSAINEIYQDLRVKEYSKETNRKRTIISLAELLKDLNESKRALQVQPRETFWEKIKASVDGEYCGIATFVEQRYQNLNDKELHLFWLLCTNITPQFIKLCMDYSNAITVSNYKRTFVKDKFGLDMKFDEYIDSYLDWKAGKKDDRFDSEPPY